MKTKISPQRQEEIRSQYLSSIASKILGPGSSDYVLDKTKEIIKGSPSSRYITGILYPTTNSNSTINNSSDQSEKKDAIISDLEEDLDPEDEPLVVDNSFRPSSFGLSFYCLKTNKVEVTIHTSTYKSVSNPWIDVPQDIINPVMNIVEESPSESPILQLSSDKKKISYGNGFLNDPLPFQEQLKNIIDSVEDTDPLLRRTKIFLNKLRDLNFISDNRAQKFAESNQDEIRGNIYQRNPINITVSIDLTKSVSNISLNSEQNVPLGLSIYAKVRNLTLDADKRPVKAVTLVMMNKTKSTAFYQSQIVIKANRNLTFCASEDVRDTHLKQLSKEDQKIRFEYRHKKTYAVGHGISAGWSPHQGQVETIFTEYLPTYELSPMSFDIEDLDDAILKPESYLLEVPSDQQLSYLEAFAEKYDEWIDERSLDIPNIGLENPDFEKIAKENLDQCRTCSKRIHQGIELLRTDKLALKAFDLANEAIILQRTRDLGIKTECYAARNYDVIQGNQDTSFKWRPFQLAFILNTLESLLDEESEYRNSLDLIWITTGGGKTEAYLCAIALLVIYQRLSDQDSTGVTVIMRYTLRLLTAQQFQRASAMICALEFLRQQDLGLGENEITVGLWVGGATTPNYRKDAKKDFNSLRKNRNGQNPFQVLECPWCHAKESIVPEVHNWSNPNSWGYAPIDAGTDNFDMLCQNPTCPFHNKLPLYVIDESIYKNKPTLLFSTVDKFAQVPIKEQTHELFVSKNPSSPRKYRPQLIIQDELHLISGPLGSIVGLYESGFDYILSSDGNKPKYIASTATIRNSKEQVRNLYDRDVIQFPPDGLDIDDSFFVKPKKTSEDGNLYGRKYIGVMGTGKSQVTTEVHLFGALLSSIKTMDLTPDEQDLFWTVVGYFNSIRELGKASTLLVDDVRDELSRLNKGIPVENKRQLSEFGNVELTSRVSSGDIVDTIQKLERPHSKDNPAIDTVIATNMLSVGIDISRLNNMIVVGQPKLTSEYIQATSRVGRNTLGLVFSLYSATKSRDRSHYETFTSYHQNMYAQVEPSSVTPYSQPALDKAVAAVLIGMLRHTVPELLNQKKASEIVNFNDELEKAKTFLIARVQRSDTEGLYANKTSEKIEAVSSRWKKSAVQSENVVNKDLFYYVNKRITDSALETQYLLKDVGMQNGHPEAYFAMNSMRDIEQSGNISIREQLNHDED